MGLFWNLKKKELKVVIDIEMDRAVIILFQIIQRNYFFRKYVCLQILTQDGMFKIEPVSEIIDYDYYRHVYKSCL